MGGVTGCSDTAHFNGPSEAVSVPQLGVIQQSSADDAALKADDRVTGFAAAAPIKGERRDTGNTPRHQELVEHGLNNQHVAHAIVLIFTYRILNTSHDFHSVNG